MSLPFLIQCCLTQANDVRRFRCKNMLTWSLCKMKGIYGVAAASATTITILVMKSLHPQIVQSAIVCRHDNWGIVTLENADWLRDCSCSFHYLVIWPLSPFWKWWAVLLYGESLLQMEINGHWFSPKDLHGHWLPAVVVLNSNWQGLEWLNTHTNPLQQQDLW